MTTETTDPLETVMEAAEDYGTACYADGDGDSRRISSDPPNVEPAEKRERLRLHVQLFAASRYEDGLREAADVCYDEGHGFDMLDQALVEARDKRLALEARLQED